VARCEAAGPRLILVSRLTFQGSWERVENAVDGPESFAAAERSMSDRPHGRVLVDPAFDDDYSFITITDV